jgi:hypothetical protein
MIAFMLSMKVNEFMEQEPSKIYSNQTSTNRKIDTQHENFEDLLICVKNDINVLLVEKKREDNGSAQRSQSIRI